MLEHRCVETSVAVTSCVYTEHFYYKQENCRMEYFCVVHNSAIMVRFKLTIIVIVNGAQTHLTTLSFTPKQIGRAARIFLFSLSAIEIDYLLMSLSQSL